MASCPSSQAAESDEAKIELGVGTEISILSMATKFSYTIPSFSMISVDLRQISFQVLAVDGTVVLFDGFIQADSSLDMGNKTPFSLKLKDYCFVTVS